ncbi:MAG: hypothetical protein RLW62_01285, partial [Gammaproteobacteria bacterium]
MTRSVFVVPLAFVLGLAGGAVLVRDGRDAGVPDGARLAAAGSPADPARATPAPHRAPLAAAPATLPAVPAAHQESPAGAPRLAPILPLGLVLDSADGQRRVTGVLLVDNDIVLVPLSALDGATRLSVADAPLPLGIDRVLAWDGAHDLAVLAVDGLPPARARGAVVGDASLYMGRECVLHSGAGPFAASVDSPLTPLDDDTLGYELALARPAPAGLAALTDASGTTLVGLARVGSGTRAAAWDVDVVAALL